MILIDNHSKMRLDFVSYFTKTMTTLEDLALHMTDEIFGSYIQKLFNSFSKCNSKCTLSISIFRLRCCPIEWHADNDWNFCVITFWHTFKYVSPLIMRLIQPFVFASFIAFHSSFRPTHKFWGCCSLYQSKMTELLTSLTCHFYDNFHQRTT